MQAEESIATAKADLVLLGGVGTEFEAAIVPAMSQQLGMTGEEFVAAFVMASFGRREEIDLTIPADRLTVPSRKPPVGV